MRNFFTIILFSAIGIVHAQTVAPDSLQRELYRVADERKVDVLNQMAFAYSRLSLEKAEQTAEEALTLATQLEYTKGIGDSYNVKAVCRAIKGDYTSALELFLKALRFREQARDVLGAAGTTNNIAGIFLYQKEYEKAIEYTLQSLKLVKELKDERSEGNSYIALGLIYDHKQDSVKSFYYFNQAKNIFHNLKLKVDEGQAWLKIGNLQEKYGFHERCAEYLRQSDESH